MPRFTSGIIAACLLAMSTIALFAESPDVVPAGGVAVLAPHWQTGITHPASAAAAPVAVQLADGSRGVRLVCLKSHDNPWDYQFSLISAGAIAKGDALLLRLRTRLIEARSEQGEGSLGVVFEQATTYDKSLDTSIAIPNQVKQWNIPFIAEADYPAGQAKICLRLGSRAQTLDVFDLELLNFADRVPLSALPRQRISWPGREADALWRSDAAARIERIRKADLQLRIVDAGGAPMVGAKIQVQQVRHAFFFGTAVDLAKLMSDQPDGTRYREELLTRFSGAVPADDLKWDQWENQRRRESVTLPGIDWLFGQGMQIRGHNLIWPSWQGFVDGAGWAFLPQDLYDHRQDPVYLRKRITERLAAAADPRLKGRLLDWDVINEAVQCRDLASALGETYLRDCFAAAKVHDPQAKRYLNDYRILSNGGNDAQQQDALERLVRLIDQDGPLIDGLGFQSHFGMELTPPVKLLQILDRFAVLGKEIKATEFDVNIEDEVAQADYLRDFYTALFSHPAVTGIVMWGFWEGDHWIPPASLLRRDWSEKPNGRVYRELVCNHWRTTQELTTNAEGMAETRGFLGDYRLTITTGSGSTVHELRLERAGPVRQITVQR